MSITRKPKIAILTIRNTYNYGGVLSSLKVVHQFCQKYFEPTVFFLGFDKEIATSLRSLKFTSSTKPLTYFGMNCFEVGARWAFWEPGHYAYTLSQWKKMLADYDYFFVVSGTCIAAHPLAQLNKKFTLWIATPYNEDRDQRVKQLVGIRALIDTIARKKMNAIEKQILEKASYTWTMSHYVQEKFEQIITKHQGPISHCGYPIDCAQVPTVNLSKKENIIVAVGRFSDPRKNIDMLIRVFSRLHKQHHNLKLYVVGMKPEHEKVYTWTSLACFKNIIFTGQVSGADLKNLYTRAKIMLITSYQEGLGIVGLEALLHGTPVVATTCGGTADYVFDDVTGYIVPINDDDAMVQQASKILSSPAVWQRLAHNGRTLIQNQFSVQQIYAHFKHGLATVYPELTPWFEKCDQKKSVPKEKSKFPIVQGQL